jgi:iron complex transport system permease protein
VHWWRPCGAGLAICGAVLQSLLKNALAEPYVLGVSAGASTGAVSVVVWGLVPGPFRFPPGHLPARLRPLLLWFSR